MHRLSLFVVALSGALVLLPSAARADSVCIASDSVPITNPGTKAVHGSLEKRSCHGVLERLDGLFRVWVTGSTFQGESLINDSDVLHLMVDDADLRRTKDGEVFGRVLSGTPVRVLRRDGDTVLVRTVEGRLDAEFVVESDAVFPTETWPSPDEEEEPPGDWPVPERSVPPKGGKITADSAGLDVVATLGTPIYDVRDVLLDPASGAVGYSVVEQSELDVRVKVITPTIWVEGYAGGLEWREDPPVGGWNPVEGLTQRPPWVPAPRQIGSKDAEITSVAKGESFGKLPAGARVSVQAEEKGWLSVSAAWPGGSVQGWVQKRSVLKEGKEEAASAVSHPVAAVVIWQMARQWEDVTGHEEENEDGVMETPEPEVDLDAVRRGLTDQFSLLRVVYARLLQRSPDSAGTLTGRILVDAEGTILKAHLPEGSLREPALQEALVSMLEGLTFEPREIPKKKRKRGEPELNWTAQVWVQVSFKNSGG
jgi:hypothetical protein